MNIVSFGYNLDFKEGGKKTQTVHFFFAVGRRVNQIAGIADTGQGMMRCLAWDTLQLTKLSLY